MAADTPRRMRGAVGCGAYGGQCPHNGDHDWRGSCGMRHSRSIHGCTPITETPADTPATVDEAIANVYETIRRTGRWYSPEVSSALEAIAAAARREAQAQPKGVD